MTHIDNIAVTSTGKTLGVNVHAIALLPGLVVHTYIWGRWGRNPQKRFRDVKSKLTTQTRAFIHVKKLESALQ